MTLILPPETSDRTVTITIPKEVDAYFKKWYLDTKKGGETPDQFAYRNLAKAGIAYRRQKLALEEQAASRTTVKAIIAEHATLVLDSGLD